MHAALHNISRIQLFRNVQRIRQQRYDSKVRNPANWLNTKTSQFAACAQYQSCSRIRATLRFSSFIARLTYGMKYRELALSAIAKSYGRGILIRFHICKKEKEKKERGNEKRTKCITCWTQSVYDNKIPSGIEISRKFEKREL